MTQKQTFARYPGYILFALVDDPSAKPGWDILDIISGDKIETEHQEAIGVGQAYQQQNSSYSNGPMVMNGQRSFVVRKVWFLMGQLEKNLVTDLTDKATTAEKLAKEATTIKETALKNEALAQNQVKSMEADRERARTERQSLVDVKNKLEADMAKLKKMLGEKTINDVLNPTAA